MADSAFDLDPSSVLDAADTQEELTDVIPAETEEPAEPLEGEAPAEGEEPAEPAEGEEPEGEEDSKDEKKTAAKGDDDVDLRKASKELRDALTKFRDADPGNAKLAKLLRTALGHDLAYQDAGFKTPQEARVFKAQVDAVGGTEGLTALQEHSVRYQEQETGAQTGSPDMIKSWAKDYSDGFKKAAPVMLEELKGLDKKAYGDALQPHLVDNLEAAGVGGVLDALHEAMEKGDTETAKRIAGNLRSWYGGQKSQAAGLRSSSVNPDREKIDAEWKKINDEKEAGFTSQWKSAVGNHASTAIYKAGLPYVKALTAPQQKDFFEGVIKEIDRRLTGDKTFAAQENALMKAKNRDINKIIQFKNAKIETLVGPAVEAVAALRRLTAGAKASAQPIKGAAKAGADKPVVGAGSSPTNPIYVKDKPPTEDRDLTIKGAVDYQIAGKALMKSGPYKGRWVSWRGKPQA